MPSPKARGESQLELFDRATAGASHDEFVEMWVRMAEAAAQRVETYVSAVEDGAPVEVLNEASRFAEIAYGFSPPFSVKNERARAAHGKIYDSRKWLLGFDPYEFAAAGGESDAS